VKHEKWVLRRIGVTAGLVLVIGGILLCLRPTNRIIKENFAKIRDGMTINEVAAILGPATYLDTRRTDPPSEHHEWIGRGEMNIVVDFQDGR
jgi:hypothetical protein